MRFQIQLLSTSTNSRNEEPCHLLGTPLDRQHITTIPLLGLFFFRWTTTPTIVQEDEAEADIRIATSIIEESAVLKDRMKKEIAVIRGHLDVDFVIYFIFIYSLWFVRINRLPDCKFEGHSGKRALLILADVCRPLRSYHVLAV